MTVLGSICTRFLIDRTLIRNAILYHFQITLFCGRINRILIPLTLFLLSRPLEQLEFIRFSNSPAEICFPTLFPALFPEYPYCPTDLLPRLLPKSISTTSFSLETSISNLSHETISSPTLSSHYSLRTRVRSVLFNLGKNEFETNIVVIHDQLPHISLPNAFLRSSRSRSSSLQNEKNKKKSAQHSLFASFLLSDIFCVFPRDFFFEGKKRRFRLHLRTIRFLSVVVALHTRRE